jgi:hypothetical protein
MKVIAIAAAIFFGAAISSGSEVIIGKTRPAISPDEVKIFTPTNPPEHYEEIAILTNRDAGGWVPSQKNKTERLIKKLKIQAAALGANGIILTGMGNVEETTRDVITTTSHLAEGQATAIWVSDKVKANGDTLSKSEVVQACIDQCREEKKLSAAACFDECAGM